MTNQTNHINNTNHISHTNHTNHINKTAIITGASRGIGAAIAKKLASCGYNLSLCCRNSSDRLKSLADELHCAYGIEVLCYTGNVGDFFFAKDMVTKTISHFGHIDVLINNAGISHIGLLSDMTPEEWNNIVAINLTGVFNFTKLVIPYMVADKCGRILQISSVWGNVGASCEVAYSACKGGINAFTKALGKELAPSHIPVNAIACGVIDTDMNRCFNETERAELADEIPAGRFATACEVADMAYSVITAPDYLTGQIITFDGGWI